VLHLRLSRIDGRVEFLLPVPYSLLGAVSSLLEELQSTFSDDLDGINRVLEYADSRDLAEVLIGKLPTLSGRVLRLEDFAPEELKAFLLRDSDSSLGKFLLADMQRFKSKASASSNFPLPVIDPLASAIATLMNHGLSAESAISACDRFSFGEISALLQEIGNRLNPEPVQHEAATKALDSWLSEQESANPVINLPVGDLRGLT
jgi:hypothetical protein